MKSSGVLKLFWLCSKFILPKKKVLYNITRLKLKDQHNYLKVKAILMVSQVSTNKMTCNQTLKKKMMSSDGGFIYSLETLLEKISLEIITTTETYIVHTTIANVILRLCVIAKFQLYVDKRFSNITFCFYCFVEARSRIQSILFGERNITHLIFVIR